ncbi:MAG: phosphate ABC transporter substrate-binding protein [Candidatus Omnitrophica bacterium]|nr:phosphate ABC transporter substrate-binding protein [Candidatus Omnitrophota bacterium]MDD5661020.1 phosphate ABC transporter substrate-binding protein [Candidatus Omnitrophota bacterium]
MKKLAMMMVAGITALNLAAGTCFAEKIVVAGSTTVLPIAQKTAEVFMDENSGVDISVRGGGSSVGITALIDGNCNIANSSRSIRDVEIQKAASRGRDPVAHIVAMDGIAVVVNKSNPVSKLSKKQVRDIYTGKITDWSQAGGKPGKIVVVSRDTASGTFEAFGELIMNKEKVVPSALMQASNQAVAQIIGQTPNAIGYVGLGFMSGELKAVEVDGVMPSNATVLSGKYPVSRPLFMYTNGKPQGIVKEYLDFIKSKRGQDLVEVQGYVGLK